MDSHWYILKEKGYGRPEIITVDITRNMGQDC